MVGSSINPIQCASTSACELSPINTGSLTLAALSTGGTGNTITVGSQPFPIAFAFGDIWVPIYGGHDVDRIHVG